VESEDGEILFVKPWEEEQDFEEFMDFVIQQEGSGEMNGEVRYAQTRSFHLFPFHISSCLINQSYFHSKHHTYITPYIPPNPTHLHRSGLDCTAHHQLTPSTNPSSPIQKTTTSAPNTQPCSPTSPPASPSHESRCRSPQKP